MDTTKSEYMKGTSDKSEGLTSQGVLIFNLFHLGVQGHH